MNKQQRKTLEQAYEQVEALLEMLGTVLATLPEAETAGKKRKAKPPVDIETPSETTQGLIDEADLLEEARRVTRAALKGNRVTRKQVESLLQDDFGVTKVSALQGVEVSRYIEELERLR